MKTFFMLTFLVLIFTFGSSIFLPHPSAHGLSAHKPAHKPAHKKALKQKKMARQPSASSDGLEGDVVIKSESMNTSKAHVAYTMDITQILDKTRRVVCYIIDKNMACVRYDK